jgi:hypothetical protein
MGGRDSSTGREALCLALRCGFIGVLPGTEYATALS